MIISFAKAKLLKEEAMTHFIRPKQFYGLSKIDLEEISK